MAVPVRLYLKNKCQNNSGNSHKSNSRRQLQQCRKPFNRHDKRVYINGSRHPLWQMPERLSSFGAILLNRTVTEITLQVKRKVASAPFALATGVERSKPTSAVSSAEKMMASVWSVLPCATCIPSTKRVPSHLCQSFHRHNRNRGRFHEYLRSQVRTPKQ